MTTVVPPVPPSPAEPPVLPLVSPAEPPTLAACPVEPPTLVVPPAPPLSLVGPEPPLEDVVELEGEVVEEGEVVAVFVEGVVLEVVVGDVVESLFPEPLSESPPQLIQKAGIEIRMKK